MNLIDRFLAIIYADKPKVEIVPPSEVTEKDIESIVPERRQDVKVFDFDKMKKLPHSIIPGELIPENALAIPELKSELQPLASSILETLTRKEEIESILKAKETEFKEMIKGIKAEMGLEDVRKKLEDEVQKFGQVLSESNEASAEIVNRYREFFFAVAKKVEENPILLSDKQKLDFVLNQIKEANTNLSRSVTLKLRWLEKKSTVIIETIKRYVRIWPIPETKRKSLLNKIAQVDEELSVMLEDFNDVAISYLSDLLTIDGTIEDATKAVNSM
jgi:hypothetical protein